VTPIPPGLSPLPLSQKQPGHPKQPGPSLSCASLRFSAPFPASAVAAATVTLLCVCHLHLTRDHCQHASPPTPHAGSAWDPCTVRKPGRIRPCASVSVCLKRGKPVTALQPRSRASTGRHHTLGLYRLCLDVFILRRPLVSNNTLSASLQAKSHAGLPRYYLVCRVG
jgi:hypothetical protein